MPQGPQSLSGRILFLHPGRDQECHLAGQLVLAGWTVVEVDNELDALQAVRGGQADLAVLHWPLTDVVDLDFANVLRGVAGDRYLPVVLVVRDAEQRHRCEFLVHGADDVIAPDGSAAELSARCCTLLRIKRLHDELAVSRSALQDSLRRERKLLDRLRKHNAHLRHLAATDPLTRLQNVRSFRDILAHEFRVAGRYGQTLSLLMLDVDHFKMVNDTYGHPCGDAVLTELAEILRELSRESDAVCRAGGEEFAVLLGQADRRQATHFAERIRREVLAREFKTHAQSIRISVSIGVASYPEDPAVDSAGALVDLADRALLAAKQGGRDRVIAYADLEGGFVPTR